jgi:hypothetical protein
MNEKYKKIWKETDKVCPKLLVRTDIKRLRKTTKGKKRKLGYNIQ